MADQCRRFLWERLYRVVYPAEIENFEHQMNEDVIANKNDAERDELAVGQVVRT